MSHIQSVMQQSVADKVKMEDILQLMDGLCEVKINRNLSEHEIFTTYFKTIDQNRLRELINNQPEKGKDIELSKKYRMEGNTRYQEKDYAGAMSLYTASLTLAPRDSTEYALTRANRSAVLYGLERYKECLVDVERVFKSEYPKPMFYKIYMRQAKCYLKLKCYGDASTAVQNAKTSFVTVKESFKKELADVTVKELENIEKILETHPNSNETVEDDQEHSSVPELTAGENPCFAYASNVVAKRKNKKSGKYVIATMDIKKGDVLFVEEPYSTSMHLFGNSYFTYCTECFTSSLTCIPCTYCRMVIFCSDECRHLHWYSRHRWECAAVRRSVISEELSLALGVLFRVSHTDFSTIVRNARVFGNKTNNYPYVNQVMTHKYSIPLETYTGYVKASAWLVVYLMHFTDYFEWLDARPSKPPGSREELHGMVGGLLLKFLCQTDANKEIINDVFVARDDKYGIGLKPNTLACALYVSSNALNHACLPNTVKSFHGSTKVVRAICDIQKGTEITVCYLEDPNMHMPDSRRKELREKFYFTCACSLCADDQVLFPWLCTKCRGRAFTTSDARVAKCMDCQHTFQLDKYTQLKENADRCVVKYLHTRDFSIMQEAIAVMSRIYHETNFSLSIVYGKSIHECEDTGDIGSLLKYVELLVDLHEAIYEPAAKENLKLLLKYCLTLVHYCLSLKSNIPGSNVYTKYFKRAKEVIDKTTELLKYHMCEKRAVNFQQNMFAILDVGDHFDGAMQQYHYNIINT